MKNELRRVVEYWNDWFNNQSEVVPRNEETFKLSKSFSVAFLGVRRSGKTILACVYAKKTSNNVLYINFEDPFFINYSEVSILDKLVESYIELNDKEPELLVLDEIQNIKYWERWVRKIVDTKKYKLIITGSSSDLLGSEISTSLTGRCLEKKVWPLSYGEFLKFRKKSPKTENAHLISIKEYLLWGGFPEVVLESETITKREILMQYLKDIIYKDIVSRHEIRNVTALEQISSYYIKHLGCLHSTTKLKNAFNLNFDTVNDYTRFLSEVFMIFQIKRFHPNFKTQIRDPYKVYVVDSGFKIGSSFGQGEDIGRLAENIVFISLMRDNKKIFYYKEKYEVDFVVVEDSKPVTLIQVSYCDLSDENTKNREVRALTEAMAHLKIDTGYLITENYQETINLNEGRIKCIPLYKWLE